MHTRLAVALRAVGILLSSPVFARRVNGHQTVGTVADILVQGTNAEARVKSILGSATAQQLSLQTVAVWAECMLGLPLGHGFK